MDNLRSIFCDRLLRKKKRFIRPDLRQIIEEAEKEIRTYDAKIEMSKVVREHAAMKSFYNLPVVEVSSTPTEESGMAVFGKRDPPKKTDSEMLNRKLKGAFIKFLKQNEEQAAVWRNIPLLKAKKSISMIATELLNQIGQNFYNWLKTQGLGDDINVENLVGMFDVGVQPACVGKLAVNVQELASVPYGQAIAAGEPHKARKKVLEQELKKDEIASNIKHRLSAFGRFLPPEEQIIPPSKDSFKSWQNHDYINERIFNMTEVWEGITDLSSTKLFCEYLYNHKEIKPPKYLLEGGFLDPKHFTKAQGK